MSGVLLGVIAVLLLAGTGVLLASTMPVRRAAEFVLTAYVIAYGSMVALCLLLSLFGAMTRAALTAGSAVTLLVASGVWLSLGARRPPGLPIRRRMGASWNSLLLLLGVVTALSLSYVVALIVGTPPNGADQLNYHLPRAALWLESDRVGYVPDAYDQRINSFAPNGEIGTTFALDVTRQERSAAFVQFAAALACAVGVFALARRLHLSRSEAVFGALLFLTLPIVLLQAASTKNDLVLASFLVAATVFLLGESRAHLGLAALATALAVGTKFTAFYGVLVLLAVVLLALPRTGRGLRLAAVEGGAVIGLYWYVLNVVETGRFFGNTSAFHGLTAVLQPRENLYAVLGLSVDSLDLPGAKGADILLYLVAALVVAAGLTFRALRRPDRHWALVALATVLVASPLLLYVLATDVGRPVLVRWLHLLGNPPAYIPGNGNPTLSPTRASDTASWFGPVGLLLVVGVGVVVIRLVRRRALPHVAAIFALTPLVWLVFVALTLTYLPWQGRFFLFPVALSASVWGLVLRVPQLAWAATALAAVTASLSLVHYAEKPSGLRLLDRVSVPSVWGMPRWRVQSLQDPALGPELRFLDERVPPDDSLALALGDNDLGYPMFDPHLERRVELVPFGSAAEQIQTRWLLANADRAHEIDPRCWRVVYRSSAGTVFKHAARCRAAA